MKGLPPLFDIPGAPWEMQIKDEVYAAHVEIRCTPGGPVHEHVCIWAYRGHKDEYLLVRYKSAQFTGRDEEQWLSPMEAMGVMLDAVARRDAGLGPLWSTTPSVRGLMGKATATSK